MIFGLVKLSGTWHLDRRVTLKPHARSLPVILERRQASAFPSPTAIATLGGSGFCLDITTMPIQLTINDGDDAAFLANVERLLTRDVAAVRPACVYITRLDNWFGDRWYGFRGKLHGVAGFHTKAGSDKFIVPPFVPERVLAETYLEAGADGEYRLAKPPKPVAIQQKSPENFSRWLASFTESGILFWYSGNSANQDMASAMLYVHTPNVTDGWYLGVRREQGEWRFHNGIRITKREFEECWQAT